MTRLRADCSDLAAWGDAIEAEVDRTQLIAVEPEEARSFRTLTRKEVAEIIPLTQYQWRQIIDDLKSRNELVAERPYARLTLAQVHEIQENLGIRPGRPSELPRGITLAVSQFKGGAGKTSLTAHLGTALAMRGYRVCMLDTDQQASLTRLFGIAPWALDPEDTLAAAFGVHSDGNNHEPMPLNPRRTHIDGLDIVPGSLALSQMEIEMLNLIKKQDTTFSGRLLAALRSIDHAYDIVLVDYQPAFSLTQLLLILAADGAIVPMPTEGPDFAGTGDFLQQTSAFVEQLEGINQSGKKMWDPFMVIHSKTKRGSSAVVNMAGSVFREHRPMEMIEDRASISACLSAMMTVYEATDAIYDIRGIRAARNDFDRVTDTVVDAVEARWAEVVANGGDYDR